MVLPTKPDVSVRVVDVGEETSWAHRPCSGSIAAYSIQVDDDTWLPTSDAFSAGFRRWLLVGVLKRTRSDVHASGPPGIVGRRLAVEPAVAA